MSDKSPVSQIDTMVVPAYGKSQELSMFMGNIQVAESRMVEAKHVNPYTYPDLEHTFNEAYRDLKRHMSAVMYQLTLAEKAMETAKANVLLDTYPEFMKDRPKSQDNADLRKAFLMKDVDYVAALDRYNQYKALESMFEGKIKVLENVARYMRKQMDFIIRSGTGSVPR